MTRLDVWLVKKGYFISRQQSKRAIRAGHVIVDGNVVKPSTHVSGSETIEVSDSFAVFPKGYSKLKSILEILEREVLTLDSFVLDIGSSAGGFLSYLAKKCMNVIGIEVSKEFIDKLHNLVEKNQNVSLIIGDAFLIDPSVISPNYSLDLLLVDVTTDTDGTTKLIERFSGLLKHKGILIAAFKQTPSETTIKESETKVSDIGYHILKTITLDSKCQEFHIAAIRQ
ncbi:MAG: S4 domain-containing protein [Candidatus Thorarchaeota archaeon]